MTESCSNCRYFNLTEKGEDGQEGVYEDKGRCRRYPPAFFYTKGLKISRFPAVLGSTWCGEHWLDRR